jgi:hypothetical protein
MEEQQLSPLESLPFRLSAVRYANPTTRNVGQGNGGHLRMEEPFAMGSWQKEAAYILRASPVTTRDPQNWQPADRVTCTTCLSRVTWFLERYATFQQNRTRR